MAFWGVEVKPGKPYTHTLDESRGKLRITQATLGNGSGPKKSTVQCNVGNKKPVLLCCLLPDKLESCSLELEFEEAEEVVFSVLGPRSVHLTGYFVGYRGARDGDETDTDGEDIIETGSDESDSYESDESYEDDFIDDGDIEMFSSSPSPKRNSGVIIEEIVDDEKPATVSGKSSSKRNNQVDGSLNGRKNLLTGPESEDEDGFPITFERKNKNNSTNKSDDATMNGTDGGAAQDKDNVVKGDVDIHAGEQAAGNKDRKSEHTSEGNNMKKKEKNEKQTTSEPPMDLPAGKDNSREKNNEAGDKKGENLATMEQDTIIGGGEEHRADTNEASAAISSGKESKKNKKKKKMAKEDTTSVVNEIHSEVKEDADNNVDKSDARGSKKKRKKAKGSENLRENGSSAIKTEDIQPQQTRTFPNGFIVEELQMGKPDGKRASVGKKIFVNYIGKLQKDGKIFDSNIGQRPFMFRLGVGQVIKGWDIGVDGMRVGDKRRLTIPPSLGYGSKKVGPIPANSVLTFDVELADVQ